MSITNLNTCNQLTSDTIKLPTSLLSSNILRQICKKLGLSQTGSKDVCLNRIKLKLSQTDGIEPGVETRVVPHTPSGQASETLDLPLHNTGSHLTTTHQTLPPVKKRRRRATELEIRMPLVTLPIPTPTPPHHQLVITADDLDKLIFATRALQTNTDLITVFDLYQIREAMSFRPNSRTDRVPTLLFGSHALSSSHPASYAHRLSHLDIRSIRVCEPKALLTPGSSSHKLRARAMRLRAASRRRRLQSLPSSLVHITPEAGHQREKSTAWWYLLSFENEPSSDGSLEVRLDPIDAEGRARRGMALNGYLSDPAQITDLETIKILDTVMSDLF